jgi:hypothetical protein
MVRTRNSQTIRHNGWAATHLNSATLKLEGEMSNAFEARVDDAMIEEIYCLSFIT